MNRALLTWPSLTGSLAALVVSCGADSVDTDRRSETHADAPRSAATARGPEPSPDAGEEDAVDPNSSEDDDAVPPVLPNTPSTDGSDAVPPVMPAPAVTNPASTSPDDAGAPDAEPSCSPAPRVEATRDRIRSGLARALLGDTLRASAFSGDRRDLEAEVITALDDGAVQDHLARFGSWWLAGGFDRDPYFAKGTGVHPLFDGGDVQIDLVARMRTEAELFTRSQLTAENATLTSFLGEPYAYVSSTTAPLYGMATTNTESERVELDPVERFGLLTHPYFLAAGGSSLSDPVARGGFIQRQLLCQELPPPPGVDVALAPEEISTTTRDYYAAWLAPTACWSCHRFIAQVGFSFESYDGFGQYRTVDNGFPVDTATTLERLDGQPSVEVSGASELLAFLATDSQAQRCFTLQLGLFLLGREPRAATRSAASLEAIDFESTWQRVASCAVHDGELDLRQAIVVLSSSPFVLDHHFACGAGTCIVGHEFCQLSETTGDDGEFSARSDCIAAADVLGCEGFQHDTCECVVTDEGGTVVRCVN